MLILFFCGKLFAIFYFFYNIYALLNTRNRILISIKIIKFPTNFDALLRICFKEIIQHNKAQFGQFSRPVVSNSLQPHESQHTRLPCPSPTPGVHPNSWALSRWCHPAMSSSVVPFSSCPQTPPSIRVFSNESTLCMRWPKYWSFSFSIILSKEIPGLISFRMDWLDLLAVQGTLKNKRKLRPRAKVVYLWSTI